MHSLIYLKYFILSTEFTNVFCAIESCVFSCGSSTCCYTNMNQWTENIIRTTAAATAAAASPRVAQAIQSTSRFAVNHSQFTQHPTWQIRHWEVIITNTVGNWGLSRVIHRICNSDCVCPHTRSKTTWAITPKSVDIYSMASLHWPWRQRSSHRVIKCTAGVGLQLDMTVEVY